MAFNQPIVSECDFKLASGLKIRACRKEIHKFFTEFQTWLESLNVGAIESQTVTVDSGWIICIISYREHPVVHASDAIQKDTVALLRETVEQLNYVAEAVEPLVNDVDKPLNPLDEKPMVNGQ